MAISNDEIADKLERVAELLEAQEANEFRIASYRKAARTIRESDESLARIYREEGERGLDDLPNIGDALAGAIGDIVESGSLGLLQRLEGEVGGYRVFATIPGIGEELAERIHDELEIETLEELERAAHDGRLDDVEGIGEKKLRGIRDSLAGRLSRPVRRRAQQRQESGPPQPPVDLLLELDEEYRDKADRGELRTIAPKRFNPDDEAWLPVMETERDRWDFTLLYSNTKRAHELDKTHDWVVIYYESDGEEDQCTVVTATSGRLEGRRVVRGREKASREYYELD